MSVREYYLKNKEVFQVARRIFSPQNVETPFATLIPFQHFATPYRAWLYISQLLLGITLLYEENKKDHIGWYDIKRNDYYLMYSGINQCEVYNCFTQYLKNIKMKTEYTFKQILRFMRDEYNAVYTRENPTGTHYQSHKKIGGVDRKLYKIYGDKIDMINVDEK